MSELFMPDDATVEIIARAVHDEYLADLPNLDEHHPAHQPWEDLSNVDRERNRGQVRDNVLKVWSIGLATVTYEPSPASRVDVIPEDDVEQLAREEHNRWMERRSADGYLYGPERNDSPPDRRHPDMVSWGDLPDHTRDKDRNPVRDIPRLFAAAGLYLVRR